MDFNFDAVKVDDGQYFLSPYKNDTETQISEVMLYLPNLAYIVKPEGTIVTMSVSLQDNGGSLQCQHIFQ